ncbi:MAG: hypothetical protein ACFB2Y_03270 [Fulvivirga sp.]
MIAKDYRRVISSLIKPGLFLIFIHINKMFKPTSRRRGRAYNQGMRFVYRRPTFILPEEELTVYCSTDKDGNYVREIIIKDGELNLVREGESQGVKIQVTGKSEFAILGKYFDFHFNRDEKGNVISFSNQYDTDPSRARTAVKVN